MGPGHPGRYRAGRPADALATYHRARHLLATDLGLEPSARLRDLEAAVLAHDPALSAPDAPPRRDAPRRQGHAGPGGPPPQETSLLPDPGRRRDPVPPGDLAPEPRRPRATLRVVVGEDDLLVREGLLRLLGRQAHTEVVGAAATYDEVLETVDRCRPDVLVTDIRMPPHGRDEGIRIARELRASQPAVGVVVLSQLADPHYARDLFTPTASGRGYLLKEHVGRPGQLVGALRAVAEGGSFLDPAIVDLLVAPVEGRERRSA